MAICFRALVFMLLLPALASAVDSCDQNVTVVPLVFDESERLWYGTFHLGESTNLSLLIDTSSLNVAVDPSLYKPSTQSTELHQSGDLQYTTIDGNGCGHENIEFEAYADTMSIQGLVAWNHKFAYVMSSTPPKNNTITSFSHDGVVGYGVPTMLGGTELLGRPFFQQLCEQSQVTECRFGVAFGTSGRGVQVLGGIDATLIQGEPTFAPIEDGSRTWSVRGDVAIGGMTVLRDQTLTVDTGTAGVCSLPILISLFPADVRRLSDQLMRSVSFSVNLPSR